MPDFSLFLAYLAVMAGTTYLVRLLPLLFVRKKIESRFLRSLLYYMPYSVLTVMTFPTIFYATDHLLSGILAAAVAVFFAWKKKSLLFVSACAAGVAMATECVYFFLLK